MDKLVKLKQTYPVARKDHKCMWCCGQIKREKGEQL